MEKNTLIDALRNEDTMLGLSDEQRSSMPSHPAGIVELDAASLKSVSGGVQPATDSETYPWPQCCW